MRPSGSTATEYTSYNYYKNIAQPSHYIGCIINIVLHPIHYHYYYNNCIYQDCSSIIIIMIIIIIIIIIIILYIVLYEL